MNNKTIKTIITCLLLTAGVAYAVPSDNQILNWTQNALKEEPRTKGADIKVIAKDGIVTLSGTVYNLAAKQYAVKQAQKITGVKGVLNEIEVQPAYRYDADITQNIKRRIAYSNVIRSAGIHISTSNGAVTLSGKAPSWSEKEEAELLASEVRGVRSVNNKIVLHYEKSRKDSEIANDIKSAIKRDVYLDNQPITVKVSSGDVTLSGNAGSYMDKNRAEQLARRVHHVKNITNDIAMDSSLNKGARRHLDNNASDEALTQRVREQLNQDSRINAQDIIIAVKEGEVTLEGKMPHSYQKAYALQDTHDVIGVVNVIDKITVIAIQRSDSYIQSDIEFSFLTDYSLENQAITSKVNKGVVTLSGNVDSWYEKRHAADLAARVRGVKQVNNDLKVDTIGRYLDSALVTRIETRLEANWITSWAADSITVNVVDGVATLTGIVEDWSEHNEAERVALRTPGIWLVDNRLSVMDWDYPWEQYSISDYISYRPSYLVWYSVY